jgi:hypothetical protein
MTGEAPSPSFPSSPVFLFFFLDCFVMGMLSIANDAKGRRKKKRA